MSKRLIHFRDTKSFAYVEARKRTATAQKPTQGNGINWASCNKNVSPPKGMQVFLMRKFKDFDQGAAAAGAYAGGLLGAAAGLHGAILGTIGGWAVGRGMTTYTISGYWNPENEDKPFFFQGNNDLFAKPCDDLDPGQGKF